MNIVLTGMRGSGKTTLGKIIAEKLDLKFIDTDAEIVCKSSMTINEIVNEFGWNKFREWERKIIRAVSKLDNCVISLGGGAVMDDKNVKALKKHGVFVLLVTPLEILKQRLENDHSRPALTREKNLLSEIEKIWRRRKERYYLTADLVCDTSFGLYKKAEEIVRMVKEYEGRRVLGACLPADRLGVGRGKKEEKI